MIRFCVCFIMLITVCDGCDSNRGNVLDVNSRIVVSGAGYAATNGIYRPNGVFIDSRYEPERSGRTQWYNDATGARIFWVDSGWTRTEGVYSAGVGAWIFSHARHGRYIASGHHPVPPLESSSWRVRISSMHNSGILPVPALTLSVWYGEGCAQHRAKTNEGHEGNGSGL